MDQELKPGVKIKIQHISYETIIAELEVELKTLREGKENCPDCHAEIISKCSDCGKIFSEGWEDK